MKKKIIILALTIASLITACSSSDSQDCQPTSITMKVNGELQTFEPIGRSIDLEGNGHRLQLDFHRGNSDPFSEQAVSLILRYKKTGQNVIEKIIYFHHTAGYSLDAEITQPQIQSNVEINRTTCFYATFSGTFTNGTLAEEITEAKVSYTYEEPFGNN
ncbi:hypothetical protein [Flavobacterium wongokense]|uniref:hypothetical protein n=1 Tax=Flavobacterium wongokense TaxID=2910674 RepID=UPI001F26C30A|nr:hypothetical protein [Flavobacterium sp. WG47]MCF6133424.1 hypothetical protein [Flavobacterium sp. WG47]